MSVRASPILVGFPTTGFTAVKKLIGFAEEGLRLRARIRNPGHCGRALRRKIDSFSRLCSGSSVSRRAVHQAALPAPLVSRNASRRAVSRSECYRPSTASPDPGEGRGLQSSMDVRSGRLGRVETHRLVFLFIANDAEHIVEGSNALSGQDRFSLDLINSAFLASAGFRIAFGPSGFPGPAISNLFYFKSRQCYVSCKESLSTVMGK